MTNLEHFKKSITAENMCEKIYCCACPFLDKNTDKQPCTERLEKWAREEYKGNEK